MPHPFYCAYQQGFSRLAAGTFRVALADPQRNAEAIGRLAARADAASSALLVLPELALTGYSIDDLLLQQPLLDATEAAIDRLITASAQWQPLLLVGAPLRHHGRLYNVALAIHRGKLLGVVPKVHLPNYREFYERRYFASGHEAAGELRVATHSAPFGTDLLFAARDVPGLVVAAEICEDLWVPVPPSATAALAGATVLSNLSASNITIGKSDARLLLCRSQSARCLAAYVYAAAGAGESTTDLAWDGQTEIFECGARLASTERFPDDEQLAIADVDLDLIAQERLRVGTFDDNWRLHPSCEKYRRIAFSLAPPQRDIGLLRHVERFPFVPDDDSRLEQDCYEAYNIQVAGLSQRMQATGSRRAVIGVSGGLDSTQALLVTAQAFDRLGLPRQDVLAYTLPGFATSDETKTHAIALMRALGVQWQELDIRPAARKMLTDLQHPYARGEPVYDITFENVQAGLRTDYLFRLANHHQGFVVGTGDLSELALGWCTYGVGDQMSHYNVNAGVPKTLMQHLIRWVASTSKFGADVGSVLRRILATEISPELIPAKTGAMQSTQDKIGPYALQDFNLFYTLRYGYRPSKIAFLALHAWGDSGRGRWPANFDGERRAYALAEISHWLRIFTQRFFGYAQFKRSAMPNGPKVAAGGSLSPRGDWRAPSDGNATVWLRDLDMNVPEF